MLRVVAIGGGHGLAASLRAIRTYSESPTAVVSVADDGGSSGLLREQLGIIPPGDLRKCLGALAGESSELARALEYRFEGSDIAGHPLGNLLIAGLVRSMGSTQAALDETLKLLGGVGRVVPATTSPVALRAYTSSGAIDGQSRIMRTSHIERVCLVARHTEAPPEACDAIAGADQVVIGPGSLYTSVLAALAGKGIREALSRCDGQKVYVANLHPQTGETEGYDVADHLAALRAHGIEVDVVLADTSGIRLGAVGVRAVTKALAKSGGLAHDPLRLAEALQGLLG
jgi:uncharacterized cofD-like protein